MSISRSINIIMMSITMTIITILFLSFAMAIDASIVSFSCGIACKKNRTKQMLLIASATGIAQFLMPFLGWLASNETLSYIKGYDIIIQGTIFVALGFKIIYDAVNEKKEDSKLQKITMLAILILAFATSIDALAAGILIYTQKTSVLYAATFIGIITFVLSCLAFSLSRFTKKIPQDKMEIFAGATLVFMGIKSFLG